jgi:hypothetical protein
MNMARLLRSAQRLMLAEFDPQVSLDVAPLQCSGAQLFLISASQNEQGDEFASVDAAAAGLQSLTLT